MHTEEEQRGMSTQYKPENLEPNLRIFNLS